MKNLLVAYNIVFLLIGNVLFSNIHSHSEHHEGNHEHESRECLECLTIESSNNYILDTPTVEFSNNKNVLLVDEYLKSTKYVSKDIYLSRAPPTSK